MISGHCWEVIQTFLGRFRMHFKSLYVFPNKFFQIKYFYDKFCKHVYIDV